MKTLIMILVVLALGAGQEKVDLNGLSEKISNQLEAKLPGWQHTRIPPFGTPETKVVVQKWCTKNRSVMFQVAVRATVEDAKKEFRSFLQFSRDPQELTGFGDEASVPERNVPVPSVLLRRGRYVIYINPRVDEDDPELLSLPAPERGAHAKAEVERMGKEFANLLSAIEFPNPELR